MNIGKLNRRITISTYGENTVTATGGYTRGAETQTETWCNARPISQSESLNNGLQLGQRSFEFTLRYEQGIKVSQLGKLTYEGRGFRVVQVLEVDESKRIITVLASERTD